MSFLNKTWMKTTIEILKTHGIGVIALPQCDREDRDKLFDIHKEVGLGFDPTIAYKIAELLSNKDGTDPIEEGTS